MNTWPNSQKGKGEGAHTTYIKVEQGAGGPVVKLGVVTQQNAGGSGGGGGELCLTDHRQLEQIIEAFCYSSPKLC